MFFQKKKIILEENVAKQSIKTMDRVVTGVILGGVIASIYGIKKLREKEHDDHQINPHEDHKDNLSSVKPIERKQGILSRIFFGNK